MKNREKERFFADHKKKKEQGLALLVEVRRLDALLRGTRLILAGIVHQVGGEVVLDEPILRMMESGDFTMQQTQQNDPISIRLVVTKKEPVAPDGPAEENEA